MKWPPEAFSSRLRRRRYSAIRRIAAPFNMELVFADGSAIVQTRSILSVVAAAALALTAISVPAYAQAANEGKAAKSAPRLAKNQKLCRSKRPDGSVKTWTCGSDQPCCVNHTFNLYTCGSQLLKCL